MQSCDIEDLTKSVTDGTPEEYVIVDKNKGTLQVDEPYKDYAAAFDIGENPYNVSKIEFTADGSYHITFAPSDADDSRARSPETEEDLAMDLLIDGHQVKVRSTMARSSWHDIPSTGTYTYANGRYVLMDYNWVMEGNTLLITDDDGITRSYTATPATPANIDALTNRLCHKWGLSRVLLKLYKGKKLLVTYHLTEEQVRKYCVDTFEFTSYGNFYRYKNGENNGNGVWNWVDQSEQNLFYRFTYFSFSNPTPVYGQNNLTVYFSYNRLYITEANEAFDENDRDEESGRKVQYKALCLYQLDVKGN